ncbi:two-component sensor histidine kinase [Flexivirga endophytica]|uniref:histidine kinase n=1 Tax=Flexivirga endophytica TaxID=1849103 RepID=A0A916WT31_9MICO|nr:histidine kinase [Flexivirga endophytica]GGB32133.1 two-component sensor histidine kinase [Flexivirga endophytica]GHB53078.1 two-component sensor histidine kinase [Flexivirga endophytica]
MDRPTRPSRFDLALSGLLTVAAVAEVALTPALTPKVPAMVFEVVMAVALAFRRVRPIPVVVTVAVAGTVDTLVGVPLNQGTMVLAAPVIAVYSVCAWASTREALLASAIFLAAFAIQSWAFDAGVGNWLFGFVFVVATLIAGITIQVRTREAERLREAAVRHEAQLEMQARDAAEHERTRIARELHDVISHSVTVMVVQAGAAERVSVAGPPAPEALEAMRTIQHVGRQALGELSGLLGVLRDGDESVGLGPQPGLGALPELFERSAAAGVVVSADVAADLGRSLPVGPQLATFRIIQEALTNVRKHSAAPFARAQVCVADGILRLTVDDDGPPREQGPVAPGGGLGLRGARERAKVYGGTVDAGPTPTGGFRVSATIPVGDGR